MLNLQLAFEHHCFESMPFEYAEDFSSVISFNGDMNQKDIGSFIGSILQFNDLTPDSLVNELAKHSQHRDEIALGGGFIFVKANIEIPFSCCGDFGEWFDVATNIQHSEQIWMGHDPTPACNYKDESVTLIASADDENSPKIEFTQAEFVNAIESVKQDILGFMKIFADWAKQHFKHDSDRLIELMAVYLSVDRFDSMTPEG